MKKKLISAMLVTVFAGVLAGCGYDDNSIDVSKIDVDQYISGVGEYTNLTVETEPMLVVDDAEVDSYIDYVLQNIDKQTNEVNRAIKEGDVANIDYVGLLDGVAFDGGTAENVDLPIGNGGYIEGFESGLVGYKAGDNVDLNLTFPEDYFSADLAGKDVVFQVKVNAVKEYVDPVLDDALALQFGIPGVTDAASFRAYITETMEKNAKLTYENNLRDAILKQIYDNTTFVSDEVPQAMFDYYLGQVQATDKDYANQYGVSLEEFVPVYYGMEYDAYLEVVNKQAKTMVQNALIAEKIARDNKLSVSAKELRNKMASDAKEYGYESVDAFKQSTDEGFYKNYLMEVKVTDYILQSATVTDAVDSEE